MKTTFVESFEILFLPRPAREALKGPSHARGIFSQKLLDLENQYVVTISQYNKYIQAGAELGQAQPKLGLDFTLLYLN